MQIVDARRFGQTVEVASAEFPHRRAEFAATEVAELRGSGRRAMNGWESRSRRQSARSLSRHEKRRWNTCQGQEDAMPNTARGESMVGK